MRMAGVIGVECTDVICIPAGVHQMDPVQTRKKWTFSFVTVREEQNENQTRYFAQRGD